MRKPYQVWLPIFLMCLATAIANAQSFRVQCPTSTITHPVEANNNSEPAYTGPTVFNTGAKGYLTPGSRVNGAIKCQQISGGDGYATMGDGTQTYMFSFGPLSGLANIAKGEPTGGTEFPSVFNTVFSGTLTPGDPATSDAATSGPNPPPGFTYNGAVGLAPDLNNGGALDGHVDVRADHGRRCDERQHPRPAHVSGRRRRIFPHPDQRRHDHAARPVRAAHGSLPRISERVGASMTACRTLRWRSTSAAASRTTTWRRMRGPTSGTATSLLQSTCRWAWLDRFTCGRARTECPWATAYTPRCSHSKVMRERLAIAQPKSCAAIRCLL